MIRGSRAPLLPLLPLLPALALLAACGEDGGAGGASTTYVSLGDSYTAAPGVGGHDDPTGCFRSKDNYPHLLADQRGLGLTDASCGSAQTANGEHEQRTRLSTVDPQFDALGVDTELVTVGIGANDGGLIPRIIFQCPAHVEAGPDFDTDSPCTDKDATLGDDSSTAVLAALPEQLVAYYDEIRERSPEATVIAVGYPQIFPDTDGCDLLPIPAGDVPWAAGIVRDLNAAIAQAAEEAGIHYLDVQTPSQGHDMCAEDPWIAGSENVAGQGAAFHPFPQEQHLVADLLDRMLDDLDAGV